jgi:hypothetical protein
MLASDSHRMIKIVLVSLLASLVILASCGDPKASVANVGVNQTVLELSNVILSGGASRDPDSIDWIQRFFWEQ